MVVLGIGLVPKKPLERRGAKKSGGPSQRPFLPKAVMRLDGLSEISSALSQTIDQAVLVADTIIILCKQAKNRRIIR